jgi:xylan 1,4-beta-xylosidase
MGTLVREDDQLLYSFFNADQVFDFLLSIGMKPFVELSFMPTALASGDQIAFHYRANVSPPKDYAQWSNFIGKLVSHWVDRYGLGEVRQWFFEVWNEPNLTAFGSGKQSDYFELYRHTVAAIKSVDAGLRVGGPATATNAWITDFIGFCDKTSSPPTSSARITTRPMPSASRATIPRRSCRTAGAACCATRRATHGARRATGRFIIRNGAAPPIRAIPLHDEPYAATFVVKTIMEANGLVEGYSYWTFSDIFEENYFPSVPFQGGFGLLNIHGIAKPAYRAYELLHALGTEMLPVDGTHPTVDAWVVRGDREITLLLTNFALPRHPIGAETVRMTLFNAGTPLRATLRRIDEDHANAKRKWQELGAPEYLSAGDLAELNAASMMERERQDFSCRDGASKSRRARAPVGDRHYPFLRRFPVA